MAAQAACSASECVETADEHCSRCHTAAYCSVACQTRDWPGHKPECKRLVAAAAALLPPPLLLHLLLLQGAVVAVAVLLHCRRRAGSSRGWTAA